MSGLISRKATINTVINMRNRCDDINDFYDLLIESFKVLPSAEPKIIHCGECAFAEVADPEDVQDGYRCRFHPGFIWFSGSFCSWAKAKAKAEVRK